MCKTTRRDGYRMAALTGLLAMDEDCGQETVDRACYLGDLMESRARAEDAERYADKEADLRARIGSADAEFESMCASKEADDAHAA